MSLNHFLLLLLVLGGLNLSLISSLLDSGSLLGSFLALNLLGGLSDFVNVLLLEVEHFLPDFALALHIVELSLLLSVDEESLLESLLGGLDALPSLVGVSVFVVGVEVLILYGRSDLLLFSWVGGFWELVASNGLGSLDRISSVGNLFLIVLKVERLHVPLALFELLFWGQVFLWHLGWAQGSVDWVRTDQHNAWHFGINLRINLLDKLWNFVLLEGVVVVSFNELEVVPSVEVMAGAHRSKQSKHCNRVFHCQN